MDHSKSRYAIAGGLLLALIAPCGAHAASVTVTGGFTSFTGQSGGANQVQYPPTSVGQGCDPQNAGVVAGTVVQAMSCDPRGIFNGQIIPGIWGPASSIFPSTLSSVEFHETQFGVTTSPPLTQPLLSNGIAFAPASPQPVSALGEEFLLGTVTFTNGTWFGVGPVNSFHLVLTTESTNDPFGIFRGHQLVDDMVMDIRAVAGGSAADNADCITFAKFSSVLGSFCVDEGQSESVDVMGKIGSLIPTRFTNPTGDSFVLNPPAAVPGPMSIVLLSAGFAAILVRRNSDMVDVEAPKPWRWLAAWLGRRASPGPLSH